MARGRVLHVDFSTSVTAKGHPAWLHEARRIWAEEERRKRAEAQQALERPCKRGKAAA